MTRAQVGPDAALVRLPNWLGDALMARPFLAALRRSAAHVVAVGPAALLALLEPDRAWDVAEPWPLGAGGLARLRAARFARAFVLPPSFSSAWLARRAGARERIGYASDARTMLLTHAPRRPSRGERHQAREYLALLDPAAAAPEAPPVSPALAIEADAGREADALLGAEGAGAPLALLAPGAIYGPAKRWPAARFAALAVALRRQGFAVLACGGASDLAACDATVAASEGACRSLAGRTSLAAQAALCARAAVVVSNDSGLAHLAAAVGAPTVAIFGSTSSAWTAPLGERVRIVQRPPACSPCFQPACAIGYVCLDAVRVADVLAAIGQLGATPRSGSAA